MTTTLAPVEAPSWIKKIPEWELNDSGAIERVIEFDDFSQAIEFVNTVADIAEEAQHHPDIAISYGTVTLSLITHSKGVLTDSDREVALRIDTAVD